LTILFPSSHEILHRTRGGVAEVEKDGPGLYTHHNDHVRKMVKEKRGGDANYEKECLEFNVKQGWGPLCEFVSICLKPVFFPESWTPSPDPSVQDMMAKLSST